MALEGVNMAEKVATLRLGGAIILVEQCCSVSISPPPTTSYSNRKLDTTDLLAFSLGVSRTAENIRLMNVKRIIQLKKPVKLKLDKNVCGVGIKIKRHKVTGYYNLIRIFKKSRVAHRRPPCNLVYMVLVM